MKAARYHGQRDLRLENDVPVPEIEKGQVLVEIEWCGICGSDLHEYLVGPRTIPVTQKPHPLTAASLPVTMGHEFCGRVSQIGAGAASRLKVGQPVMVDPRLYCGSCDCCKSSRTNVCSRWGFLGLHGGGGGGFSEFVAVNEDMCYVLPDSVALSQAALIEPLTVARHAMKSSGFKAFENLNVLVLGGGPIGLAVILNLRACNTAQIFVSEPTEKRANQTREFADKVFNPRLVDVAEECLASTAGKGVDLVVDCAGLMPALKDGMKALTRGGTYLNVAGWETDLIMPLGDFALKECVFRTSMSYTDEDFRETVDAFVSGKYQGFEKLISGRILLDDLVTKGFEELIRHKDDHVKILVTPKHELLKDA
ncbi:hypothetical protein Z517_03567 [Fonsecaea pedrosoi CBS 271.37]|uniref:Enoyl reductase (ER) domain-containing protein n=1 Tax=Fonsecaea pedrosoi CBS 271.37 TaxID=1442368 RepID=A0A0D2FCG1_9EURO|nr:uncharacterized protein Z517_03567 [Fonsecaea pedrosoi CBS 271.37]KIW84317.1 hypothetical protein Z517_03567 [Fonsecaea pedrosoi CBS 271.37]